MPLWISQTFGLLKHSWVLMVSSMGTTTLGFVVWTVIFTVLGWAVTVLISIVKNYQQHIGRPVMSAVHDSVTSGLATIGVMLLLLMLAWGVAIVAFVYSDHNRLIQNNLEMEDKVSTLQRQLVFRQHNLSTDDPAFSNISNLLQVFAIFRTSLHGESCVVKVTAPDATQGLARTFAQLSVNASNCPTFGPMNGLSNIDPEIETDMKNGMVSDAIVFHAAKDDMAANQLFTRLSNYIKLVRSYEMPRVDYQVPPGGYAHTIWLQFGDKVAWNSERYADDTAIVLKH